MLAGDRLVEWGVATRWICAGPPARARGEAAAAAGGHAVIFRGRDKSAGAFAPLQGPLLRIHQELKKAFDPDGLFNRGRLLKDL